jgi:heme exporter protein C
VAPPARSLRPLAIASVLALAAAAAMIFAYAPLDANEGIRQKIFYVHVPMAIVALVAFVVAGAFGIAHLRTGRRVWDLRSYVVIHLALILGVGVLVTGSLWAKAAWGAWWIWEEPMLVSFLIVFLLYATYQPLRFSIEDPERQARYASVFAIVAGAFVPVCFTAVRMAQPYIHPRTFDSTENLPGAMALTLLVSMVAMVVVFVTLCVAELHAKRMRGAVAGARRALGEPSRAGRTAQPQVIP